jgi:hypothetical protein
MKQELRQMTTKINSRTECSEVVSTCVVCGENKKLGIWFGYWRYRIPDDEAKSVKKHGKKGVFTLGDDVKLVKPAFTHSILEVKKAFRDLETILVKYPNIQLHDESLRVYPELRADILAWNIKHSE